MTGDASGEALVAFLASADMQHVIRDHEAHMTPVELRMLDRARETMQRYDARRKG